MIKLNCEFPLGFRILITALIPALAYGQIGETRTWTDTQGRKIEAKLARIDGDSILLDTKGRTFSLALEKLSEVDRAFINSSKPKPPAGEIRDYAIQPAAELATWLEENHMKSLEWRGKPDEWSEELSLPFQLHIPPKKDKNHKEKIPLLVHLHGAGAIGKDNLKQLTDGGGAAKLFMTKQFQGYQSCYIMIPQTARMSGWYALSDTDPAPELLAIVHAIRLMTKSPVYDVDLSRIYVTGISMGGAGAFQAMAKFPGFFAASIPISYVDVPDLFNKYNCGPMWVAVNAGDENNAEELEIFRRHYVKMGGKIKTTVFEAGGHDAWTKLLSDKSFRNWLFRRELD